MPTWFRLPSFQSVLSGMLKTFARFPLPLICAVSFTFMGLAGTHNFKPFIEDKDLWAQFQTFFSLGFFLLLSIKVLTERNNWSLPIHLILAGTGIGLLFLHIYPGPSDYYQLLYLGTGILFFIFVAPFLNRENDNTSFWNVNARIIESAIHAIFSLVALALGISAALKGVNFLFGVDIDGKLYSDIWAVCAFLIGPWIFLASVPQNFSKNESHSFPAKCNFFVTFILVPLVTLYVVILYAYIAKILFQWELPKGQVTYLVISYSSLGVLTHLLAFKVKEKGNRALEIFERYFYPSLFAPIFLLIVGMTERVSAYGITESRYTVILLALWLTLTTIYFSFGKGKRFKIIPLQLSLLFILGSFGPWGVDAFSQKSQVTRLETLLVKNDILVEGKIVPATASIPQEDSKNISSIMRYLVSHHKNEGLPSWLNNSTKFSVSKTTTKKIMQTWGVKPQETCWKNDWFHLDSEGVEVWEITGFDYISKELHYNHSLTKNLWSWFLVVEKEKYELTFDNKSGVLTVTSPNKDEVQFDINPITNELLTLCKNTYRKNEMTLDSTTGKTRARLVIENIQGKLVKDTIEFSYLSFRVLLGTTADQPAAEN